MKLDLQPGGPGSVWLAYNEAENSRDLVTLRALVSPDLVAIVNGLPAVASVDEDEATMQRIFELYPDYVRMVVEVLEIGDRTVARWRMRGTPADPTRVPELDIAGCSIVTVVDGMMSEAALYCSDDLLSRIARGEVG